MNNINEAFGGTHIKILFVAESKKLHNCKLLSMFLCDLVERIGMQKLRDPIIDNVALRLKEIGANCFYDEGGISGIVTLSTSHIACHTWPAHKDGKILDEPGNAVLDVYSCREFDGNAVLEILQNVYQPLILKYSNLSYALKIVNL